MMDANKKYWIYIEPHVYCIMKDAQALLYNTMNGEKIETCLPEIIALLESLHEKKNLGAICCEGRLLNQEPYLDFVVDFSNKGMGKTVDATQISEKPIQLMPVLNLQRDVIRLQNDRDRSLGEDLLYYLQVLNVYLYSGCQRLCPFCDDCFRQCLCCTKTHPGIQPEAMEVSTLENLLSQIRYGAAGRINLLGGNILEYPYLSELPAVMSDFQERVHIWNHYANFLTFPTALQDFNYDIPVTFPIDDEKWNNCFSLLEDKPVCYHFYLTNAEEYEASMALIEKYGTKKYMIHPVYTKSNIDFFEAYIYSDREDIFQSILPFRRIFAHQKMNTHFFGSLTVLPNGDVYANINNSLIGNIKTDRILDIINTEMLANTAWRKIRDSKPCSDCLYQYLCPSPSNYETVIGKPNLCHVKK